MSLQAKPLLARKVNKVCRASETSIAEKSISSEGSRECFCNLPTAPQETTKAWN